MNREGHDNIEFFIGPEVEHTPAYSKKTLFVVGKQTLPEILHLVKEHRATHVFMGANHSFDPENNDPYWDEVITALLDRGIWVSLDYEAHQHANVLKMLNPGIWQSRIFVPLLSVRIPKFESSSPNLTVKIDDVDFKATNPGVWCLHYHQLTDSNRFTDWNDYGTDVVVQSDMPTPMPPYNTPPSTPVKKVDLKDLKTVYLEPAVNPPLNLEKVREIIENSKEFAEVKNDSSLGLDPDSPSVLKDDPDEENLKATFNSLTNATDAKSAAEAYAGAETKETTTAKEPAKKNKSKA